jgi:PAT family beta-lactamase induction signal transducer AmpG
LVAAAPRSLREAIWEPFVGFFQKPRALEIAGFILFYKLADNLATSLVRPFLVQQGYDPFDVGIASGTIGLLFTVLGTFVGGMLTTTLGLGRALWIFGCLQALSNCGYALVASVEPNRPLMYAAMAIDAGFSGMGYGAFGVLLIRLTQKRFSATQYALFSSLFALGRTIAGPIAGATVDAIGWRDFFLFTILCAAPGLAMLQRFAPWAMRELPQEPADTAEPAAGSPVTRMGLLLRGLAGCSAGVVAGLCAAALLAALKGVREGRGFHLLAALQGTLSPSSIGGWLDVAAASALGLLLGIAVAAWVAARRGLVRSASNQARPPSDSRGSGARKSV